MKQVRGLPGQALRTVQIEGSQTAGAAREPYRRRRTLSAQEGT